MAASQYTTTVAWKTKNVKKYFGDLECKITLLSDVISTPFTWIEGEIMLKNDSEIHCQGIRVQLEATLKMKFETKDNRTVESNQGLFLLSSPPGKLGYIKSPVKKDLIKADNTTSSEGVLLQPFQHSYKFKLKMPEQHLPAPSKTQYGAVEYRVAVYIKTITDEYVEIAKHPLQFSGYINCKQYFWYYRGSFSLEDLRKSMKSPRIKFTKTAVFSFKKFYTAAVFKIYEIYVLPGKDIEFRLSFDNPNGCFVEKIIYYLRKWYFYIHDKDTKSLLQVLDTLEFNDIGRGKRIQSDGKFTLKEDSEPGCWFKVGSFGMLYDVAYEVSIKDYEGQKMSSHLYFLVGTTNDKLAISGIRELEPELVPPPIDSSSTLNGQIEAWLATSNLKPSPPSLPSYSQLPSRATSTTSFQTLPPHYQDLSFNSDSL